MEGIIINKEVFILRKLLFFVGRNVVVRVIIIVFYLIKKDVNKLNI